SVSDSRRRVANDLFNRLTHKNADRFLARDYERLPHTLAGFHFLAFACLMLPKIIDFIRIGS
ncbi:hypothetical protein WK77_30440, partial [Burkholderia ubonensis]